MARKKANPLELSNRDVQTFTKNAMNTTVGRVQDDDIPTMRHWAKAFLLEAEEWVKKGHLNPRQIIGILCFVANELQYQLTQEEKV